MIPVACLHFFSHDHPYGSRLGCRKQFYILALNSNCINEYINEQIKLLDTLDYILNLLIHFLCLVTFWCDL